MFLLPQKNLSGGGGGLVPRGGKYGFKAGIKYENFLFRVVISC